MIEAKAKYEAMGLNGEAFKKAIAKVGIGVERQQPLHNLSGFTSHIPHPNCHTSTKI
ncbi:MULTISPECIES: hypothetical protein [Nostocales]|uniref:Uncharacterized protein n=1 Tax=Dolichospermum flos-aquae LEGE 04289 TaxID=1828708 RepID=A0ACC5Q3G0_DOLFA|nr:MULTISPECIES: hypothetical protein [Nostocales]MBD2268704.1 hypothetical protein [Anabaena sp. FACHB-1391]MBE9218320.1 hypothetical protein [Dolichospermum flos-aquae LEGE 04289]